MNNLVEIALISRRTGYLMSELGSVPGLYSFNKAWVVSNKLVLILAAIVDTAFYLIILGATCYGIYKLSKRFL